MTARAFLLLALLAPSLSAQSTELPDAPGADVARSRCLACHGADLILEQRLTPAAWDREVAKMERWGAQLAATQREQLVTYLAMNFGAGPVPSHDAASTRGETIYQAACRTCHDDDLTAQQRLTRAAWERTVDKMVRWGANVTADQKGPLVTYLSSQWGD